MDSIARLDSAYIRPTRVEICSPIQYQSLTTNYSGPRRKPGNITEGNSEQFRAIALVDVCYRIFGVAEEIYRSRRSTNHLHHLQEMFRRRLNKGQSYSPPVLGWRNFQASYVGEPRADTRREKINMVIPTLLFSPWDRVSQGAFRPSFQVNVNVADGTVEYPHPAEILGTAA